MTCDSTGSFLRPIVRHFELDAVVDAVWVSTPPESFLGLYGIHGRDDGSDFRHASTTHLKIKTVELVVANTFTIRGNIETSKLVFYDRFLKQQAKN